MRQFLLIAHRVPVSGAFTLNDLAGGAGRMDEIARAVSNAFTLSNDLRRDTEMTVLFVAEPPPRARRIRIVGSRLRHLYPDERSTAAILKNALVRSIPLTEDVEASPGVTVGPVDPASELRAFAARPRAFYLSETGRPARDATLVDGEFAAILGDPEGLTGPEVDLLAGLGLLGLSLGPRSLRSSQCVDLLHNLADLRGAEAVRAGTDPISPPSGSPAPGTSAYAPTTST
ncbi:MAG: tRNA (pseudouridine(54)-N(1))-methyltransferase TrmY [Thermoplasmata archaeon]|nr:tRNA (pseudouridine(54)-N(1))-methyltransferase TrmY [Thermoplasmata archaeon]